MLPADATYPIHKMDEHARYHLPMPRKSPFLDMTDLYNEPGSAQAAIDALRDQPEAQELLAAEIAYAQANIDAVYDCAQSILSSHSGFYSVIAGGMLLAQCALWKGDEVMWKMAKMHICEAPWHNTLDQSIIGLSLSAVELGIRNTRDFPDWFTSGCFEKLPADAHPAAKVFYVRYMMALAHERAMDKQATHSENGLNYMRFMPMLIEPFIAQAVVDKTVLVEIYLRLLCAAAYQSNGQIEKATEHVDRAIALALPDMLLAPMVELRRQLGYLLDDRLALQDQEALKQLKILHKQQHAGWTKLHNAVLERQFSARLSVREREVARLAAYGLSDGQIAEQLMLSKSTVKSLISMAKNKTGAIKRADLAEFV